MFGPVSVGQRNGTPRNSQALLLLLYVYHSSERGCENRTLGVCGKANRGFRRTAFGRRQDAAGPQTPLMISLGRAAPRPLPQRTGRQTPLRYHTQCTDPRPTAIRRAFPFAVETPPGNRALCSRVGACLTGD
jgi:hypothetical protein